MIDQKTIKQASNREVLTELDNAKAYRSSEWREKNSEYINFLYDEVFSRLVDMLAGYTAPKKVKEAVVNAVWQYADETCHENGAVAVWRKANKVLSTLVSPIFGTTLLMGVSPEDSDEDPTDVPFLVDYTVENWGTVLVLLREVEVMTPKMFYDEVFHENTIIDYEKDEEWNLRLVRKHNEQVMALRAKYQDAKEAVNAAATGLILCEVGGNFAPVQAYTLLNIALDDARNAFPDVDFEFWPDEKFQAFLEKVRQYECICNDVLEELSKIDAE